MQAYCASLNPTFNKEADNTSASSTTAPSAEPTAQASSTAKPPEPPTDPLHPLQQILTRFHQQENEWKSLVYPRSAFELLSCLKLPAWQCEQGGDNDFFAPAQSCKDLTEWRAVTGAMCVNDTVQTDYVQKTFGFGAGSLANIVFV